MFVKGLFFNSLKQDGVWIIIVQKINKLNKYLSKTYGIFYEDKVY